MPSSRGLRRRSLGISLIEALVAMAVMGFGTLAVLGVQSTLRFNADISKQRSEALRIAQLRIEDARDLGTLGDFDALGDEGPEDVVGETGETTFTVTQEVDLAPPPADDSDTTSQRSSYKSVTVTVGWTDRTGAAQSVALDTVVHAGLPALSGSLSVPADLAVPQAPLGRHRAIPLEAVDQGDGTSQFTPPGAPDGVRWTFNNVSGVITRLCDTCDPVNALLLTGFVRYALTPSQPAGADAEIPPSTADFTALAVSQTAPPAVPAPACYSRLSTAYVTYYCAVISNTSGWSGRADVVANPSVVLSSGAEVDRRRVCRYTPVSGCDPTVGDTIWGSPVATCSGTAPTPSRRMTNADHPLNYSGVKEALLNQNFLVIRAGDGSTAFTCPGDDSSTAFVNGQTRQHQP